MMPAPRPSPVFGAIRDRREDKTLKGAARRLIRSVRCIRAGATFASSSSTPAALASVSST